MEAVCVLTLFPFLAKERAKVSYRFLKGAPPFYRHTLSPISQSCAPPCVNKSSSSAFTGKGLL